MRVHFMGIGGSGMSAAAQIAKHQGYEVTGCDLQTDTPYLEKIRHTGIPVFTGHDISHLQNIDLLCVTPAVFYQNNNHPSVEMARQKRILFTWQQFLGRYLHHDKFVISVAGTHGKSTTTALTGLLLEAAGKDPTVEVGATVLQWHNNVRLGKGTQFVSEADEFYDNYAEYKSDIILLTLLEYDHPEYFGSVDNMLSSFQKFINNIKPGGLVIYNADSPLIARLTFPPKSIGYHPNDLPPNYPLGIPGRHNRSNATAVLLLARALNIPDNTTQKVFADFQGVGRRLELLGEKHGIQVYDDYANHPSSFRATISTLKELYPDKYLLAVIEPHTYSRLRCFLPELPDSVSRADEVIVSKIFASREADPGNFTGADIVSALRHPKAQYIPEFPDIVKYLITQSLNHSMPRVILVMGSGDSYKLSRQILESL